jgi:hypothetical protein
MKFEEILMELKDDTNDDVKAYRKGWNGIEAGIDMYIYLVRGAEIDAGRNGILSPDPFFIFHHSKNDTDNIWIPSIWDIMVEDWEIRKN